MTAAAITELTNTNETRKTAEASTNSNKRTKGWTKTTAGKAKTVSRNTTTRTSESTETANKDIGRTLSNRNNIACAHPLKGEKGSEIYIADLKNRKGVG